MGSHPCGHQAAKYLLLRGANIDTQDYDKWTPLHGASNNGRTSIVQLLLQCGANKETKNTTWGRISQDVADNEETEAVFREFNEKGLKTKEDFLKQAVSEENKDVAIILIFRGVSLEGSDTFKEFIQMIKKTGTLNCDFIRNQFPWIK